MFLDKQAELRVEKEISNAQSLCNVLQVCSQEQLTDGCLEITSPEGLQWSLYFHYGHLIGDTGGVHPVRRWCRQLAHHCPQMAIDAFNTWNHQSWDYASLAELVRQGEIRREQMVAVVKDNVAEVLFDILQQEEKLHYYRRSPLAYTYVPDKTLYASPLVFVQTSQAWHQAQLAWSTWQQAGLTEYSPNMTPIICHHSLLQQATSSGAYRSFSALFDGRQTIRDLSLKLKQKPHTLTQSLVPYIQKGLIQLTEFADMSNSVKRYTTLYPEQPPAKIPPLKSSAANNALVAYIDDSSMDSRIMGQILAKAGYQYMNLLDPVLALPTLLEQKPKLIFLDLVMPVANGYEICAQIRRCSMFQNTPVVIVTGNDGIVDRVRAKIVRASDFIAKPITTDKIWTILRKYASVLR